MEAIQEFKDICRSVDENTDRKKAILFKVSLFLMFVASYQTFMSPVFYKDPGFLCKNSQNQTYSCNQQEACKQFYKSHQIDSSKLTENDEFDYSEIMDQNNLPDSMVVKFQLVCNRQSIKIKFIQQFFRGAIAAFVIQALIKINNKMIRKCYMIILWLMILGGSIVVVFIDNMYLNNYGFTAKQFARQSIHTICFDFVKDYYQVNYLQYYQILQNIGYTFGMFYFPMLNWSINTSYYYLVAITAIFEIVFIPCFIYYSIGITDDKEKSQQIVSNQQEYPIQTNIVELFNIIRRVDLNFIIVLFNVFAHRLHFSLCILYIDFSKYPNIVLAGQGLMSFYFGIKLNKMIENGNEYSLYKKILKITSILLLAIGFISPSLQFNNPIFSYLFEILFCAIYGINSANQTLIYVSIPRFLEVQYFSILFNLGSIFQRTFLDVFLFKMYYLRQECDMQVIAGLLIIIVLVYLFNHKLKHTYPSSKDDQNVQSAIAHSQHQCISMVSKNTYDSKRQKHSSIMLQDFTSIHDNNDHQQTTGPKGKTKTKWGNFT